ncbi:MAG TPA: sulfite exporter TauE/SafE family protein, partial [Allosphingosinicella sp.]
ALGLSFTVSTIALAAGLASRGAFHLSAAGISLACIVPALIGMFSGQWIRLRVDAATFRLIFFVGLFLLGSELALRSVL